MIQSQDQKKIKIRYPYRLGSVIVFNIVGFLIHRKIIGTGLLKIKVHF